MLLYNAPPSSYVSLLPSGTIVYNAAAPVAWTDLDLSGTIGAIRGFVFLRVLHSAGVGNLSYSFKRDGDSAPFMRGIAYATAVALSEVAYLLVPVEAGICEWHCTAAEVTVVTVLGWLSQY